MDEEFKIQEMEEQEEEEFIEIDQEELDKSNKEYEEALELFIREIVRDELLGKK